MDLRQSPVIADDRPGSVVTGPLQDQRRLVWGVFIKTEHVRQTLATRKTIDPEHLLGVAITLEDWTNRNRL